MNIFMSVGREPPWTVISVPNEKSALYTGLVTILCGSAFKKQSETVRGWAVKYAFRKMISGARYIRKDILIASNISPLH